MSTSNATIKEITTGSQVKAYRDDEGKKVLLHGVVLKHSARSNVVLFENGEEDSYKVTETELKLMSKKAPSKPKLVFCAVVETTDEDDGKGYLEITPVFTGKDLTNPAPLYWVVPVKLRKQAAKFAKSITDGKTLKDIELVEKRGKVAVTFEAVISPVPRTSKSDDAYAQSSSVGRKLKKLIG
jgi:hypothetical protein